MTFLELHSFERYKVFNFLLVIELKSLDSSLTLSILTFHFVFGPVYFGITGTHKNNSKVNSLPYATYEVSINVNFYRGTDVTSLTSRHPVSTLRLIHSNYIVSLRLSSTTMELHLTTVTITSCYQF